VYKNLVILISLFILTSCASLIPKPHEMPSPAFVFIHDNPKAGDFASYGEKNSSMGLIHHYEVYQVSDDAITIRYQVRYTNPNYKELAPKEWYYRLIDRDGMVKKAWAKTDSGEVFTTPVAKPDTLGSFEHLTAIKLDTNKPIKITAGQFNVDAINSYIYRTDLGLLSTNSSCLEYYSNQVPFRSLKREMLHTSDVGALLKTTEYLQTAGDFYLTENYMKLYNQATKKDIDYQNTMELLEYGYAK